PRVAETLEVQAGWERAVETALGDYLEAVCVEGLDALAGSLESLAKGRVTLVETNQDAALAGLGSGETLATKGAGPVAVTAQLVDVFTAETLADALQARGSLANGQSIITRGGEWIGRDWLRVSRGPDHHAGVIEREQRLKGLRASVVVAERRASELE